VSSAHKSNTESWLVFVVLVQAAANCITAVPHFILFVTEEQYTKQHSALPAPMCTALHVLLSMLLVALLPCVWLACRGVVADVVDTLAATGGNALKLVHTHDGSAAAAMALAYGTPKDRKRLVKGMKGACHAPSTTAVKHSMLGVVVGEGRELTDLSKEACPVCS
jgi:hypothetical protein